VTTLQPWHEKLKPSTLLQSKENLMTTVQFTLPAQSDDGIEYIVYLTARYDAIRALYQRMRDNPLMREHPNFDVLLAELARIGQAHRDEVERATLEWLDSSFLDVNRIKRG
jgi:hypothetical protein